MTSRRDMFANLKRFLACSLLATLCSSCAVTNSILSGGNAETQPMCYTPGLAPVAQKRSDGSLLLKVHFETTEKGALGELFQPSKSIQSREIAFVAPYSSLQPALNIIKRSFPNYDEQMIRAMFADARVGATVSHGGSIKVYDGWPVNGSQLVCPSKESVILGREIVWYVPGKRGPSDAKATVIPSPSGIKSPMKTLPVKALLLPLGVLGDAALNTWVGVAVATGKPIDM